jgi:hypothetical protein
LTVLGDVPQFEEAEFCRLNAHAREEASPHYAAR